MWAQTQQERIGFAFEKRPAWKPTNELMDYAVMFGLAE
jgi:hypothetical protein